MFKEQIILFYFNLFLTSEENSLRLAKNCIMSDVHMRVSNIFKKGGRGTITDIEF